MRHLVHVISAVMQAINILVAVRAILEVLVQRVVVSIRVVPVQVVITGQVVLVWHIVTHVLVDRMNQVQVVVMALLEQYLRNVAVAQHPELVILVNLVLR